MGSSGAILLLFAVCAALILILFALVAVAKVRRDRVERASAEFRDRFRESWRIGDASGLREAMDAAARDSIDAQADLLAALRSCEAEAPDAPGQRLAAASAQESGLMTALITQLGSPDPVRRGLAVWLGALHATRLPTHTIARQLSDPDPTVRLAAAGALERHSNAEAASALITALDASLLDPPRIVERLGHAWAVPELIARLPRASTDVQPHLASALGLAMDPRAIVPLIALARESRTPETRIAAVRALARCAPSADGTDRLLLSEFARASLSDGSARIRGSAIRILATPGVPTDLDRVSSALGDPDWFVRRAAAQALVALGAPGMQRLEVIASGADPFAADRAREELALAAHHTRDGGDGA